MMKTKLSSNLTQLSRISLLIFGPLIAFITGHEMHWTVWGLLTSLLMLLFSGFFVRMTAELFHEPLGDTYLAKTMFGPDLQLQKEDIQSISKLNGKNRHGYYYFKTKRGNFVVIEPMWGAEKQRLAELHLIFAKGSSAATVR